MKSTIKKIVSEKGFGFIQNNANKSNDVFFHCSVCEGRIFDCLKVGDTVEYELDPEAPADKGLRAKLVRLG